LFIDDRERTTNASLFDLEKGERDRIRIVSGK
jgi:hypothetical protein